MTRKVGYGSPPEHSQWKKGQSGNPAGRKKGQLNLKTDLFEELAEVIQVSESGKPRKLSKQRALLKALTARAISGDARAASLILKLMMQVLDPPAVEAEPPLAQADKALLDDFLSSRKPLPREDSHD